MATKDGKRAYVTHDYPGTVTEIDLAARKVSRTFKAGDGSRGIALAPDEKTLYVTEFFTGTLLAIDLDIGKVVDTWEGGSTDNLCRHVVLHPTRPKAYLSHIRSRVTAFDGQRLDLPAAVDLRPRPGRRARSAAGRGRHGHLQRRLRR